MEESGLNLEHPVAARFRVHILSGNWTKVRLYVKLYPFPDNLQKRQGINQRIRISHRFVGFGEFMVPNY